MLGHKRKKSPKKGGPQNTVNCVVLVPCRTVGGGEERNAYGNATAGAPPSAADPRTLEVHACVELSEQRRLVQARKLVSIIAFLFFLMETEHVKCMQCKQRKF